MWFLLSLLFLRIRNTLASSIIAKTRQFQYTRRLTQFLFFLWCLFIGFSERSPKISFLLIFTRGTNPSLKHFSQLFYMLSHFLYLSTILIILFLQLLILSYFWIHISTRSIIDKWCHTCIIQSLQRLLEMIRTWIQTSDLNIHIFTIEQYVLPPILCFNKLVNFESRYGICFPGFSPWEISYKAAMTCLKVNKLLLISIPYLKTAPVALVTFCL